MTTQTEPDLQIWVNDESLPDGTPLVAIAIGKAHIVEEEDGELLAGLCLTPRAVRELCAALLVAADEAENP